jgi:hypothetical protein
MDPWDVLNMKNKKENINMATFVSIPRLISASKRQTIMFKILLLNGVCCHNFFVLVTSKHI